MTASRDANRTTYLNALYDIQANGMTYDNEGAFTAEALQTPGAAARTTASSDFRENF